MLLAAFCFAKSSNAAHNWLINHNIFGPAILDWQSRGAISGRGKIAASTTIVLSFALSVTLVVPGYVLAAQVVVLAGVMLFIWTRPS